MSNNHIEIKRCRECNSFPEISGKWIIDSFGKFRYRTTFTCPQCEDMHNFSEYTDPIESLESAIAAWNEDDEYEQ